MSGQTAKRDFLDFCNFSVSVFKEFNSIYARRLSSRTGVFKRLFQKEDRISVPLNREPKPGSKLDLITKERFEAAFDTNLESVRIHTGEYATEITRRANAEAVTIGSDIYFAQGNYNIDSEEGLILLAHELQHVVQFKSGKRAEYREDIANMESESDRVEGVMKKSNLHGLTRGGLKQNSSPGIEEQAGLSENLISTTDIASTGTLDDFADDNREIIYRLHIGNKVIEVTKKERDEIINRAVSKLDGKIESEISLSSGELADEKLLRFTNFIK